MEAKILLVDDENAIRKMLTKYLEGAGYTCCTAENVDSAKKILASEAFDLLLSDLKMPGESGLALLRYAKEHYPQMGRVMITGFAAPEIASEILTVGVYGYIIKPLTRDMVLITVEKDIRIILCTGYSNKISAESAQKVGINAFTYKPFSKAELASTVREVLDSA
ncbi:MAG: DNA-binding NtrC family response regulator [Desulforhopalus sp.]|jgi:DNA-binding NtrC family response regulator